MNILATSGGLRLTDRRLWAPAGLMLHAMDLSEASTPRICLLHTASGDNPAHVAGGYQALVGTDCRTSHLELFPMPNHDPAAHLLAQDVIWVMGGSVANLLAIWRVHGLDEILREAWTQGVVLGGVSAGSLCWHNGGTTDSYGPDLRPVTNGLGLLPHSNCPHYDSEAQRRPFYQSLVADGTVGDGWATDDGVGLHFAGTAFVEALAEREGGHAYRVVRGPDGGARETRITPRPLF